MENNKTKLDGKTINEQVNSFMSILKDKTISVEELEHLIPLNTEFVKGLLDVIQKEIEADEKGYSSYLQVMNNIIDSLRKICEGQNISSEERKEILAYMLEIGKIIKEVELSRNNNKTKIIVYLSILAALVLVILGIFIGKKNHEKSPLKKN